MRVWAAACLALAAAACQAPMERASVGALEAAQPALDVAAAPAPAEAPADAAAPLLAYEHAATLELPARAIGPTLRAHEQACVAAGPATCQVVSAQMSAYDEDQVSAALEIRAEPGWLAQFCAGLAQTADQAGGRVRSEGVAAQDLTRDIVDGEARLRALRTLRDRLQAILASRPARVSELLEVERELARVQGELDAMQSVVAALRRRVDASILRIAYESKPAAVTGGTFEPISQALSGFLGVSASVVAVLIYALAAAIPLALVLGPLGWLALRAWRRRRKRAVETEA